MDWFFFIVSNGQIFIEIDVCCDLVNIVVVIIEMDIGDIGFDLYSVRKKFQCFNLSG